LRVIILIVIVVGQLEKAALLLRSSRWSVFGQLRKPRHLHALLLRRICLLTDTLALWLFIHGWLLRLGLLETEEMVLLGLALRWFISAIHLCVLNWWGQCFIFEIILIVVVVRAAW